jgi:hypothetical protein
MVNRLVSVGDDFNLPAAVNVVEDNLPTRLSDASLTSTYATPATVQAKVLAPRGRDFAEDPFPVFEKHPTPIFTAANTTYSTIYHPSVLRVDNILESPMGKFYMWYSTDHKGVDGKIGLAYADQPEGPWTNHGTVWVDTTAGQETETPSVVWNPKENLFFMSYQMDWNGNPAAAGAVGAQSTLLATSPDGINWTRVGIIIDLASAADVPGNGHTGYARLHRFGSTWVALHLLGGGDYSHRGISYSRNGRNWVLDTRPIEPQTHFAGDSQSKTILYELFQWRGELWGIGTEGTIGSGVDAVVRHLVFGRVTHDMRHFAEVPERLIELDAGWETTNIRTVHVFSDEGKVYVIYQTDNNFGLAVAGA